ncbi:Malonyl-[acyl-carrier protein] O-methyltransferase [Georgfuchsia toluolica]|uniref:Malonyl-[acyl-carrier protein] O-methyltransferase n=1 Tax=Georgfuchsia toluolica TaxID=424218 RepID=A0A916J5X9_9PROT|nr:malonyl-ACP O-methyltransferase BioC [Georgfuchsia toluolica]CAG4883026.1 Malonyl-[acyl-carrier protein] O-methyltransferase [Georgfuchsia toluolica]
MKPEKQLVRSAFARAAPHYDAVADFQRETGERLSAQCQMDSLPARVLDAGCGTGHGLQLIAGRWPKAEIVALDFAAPMLHQLPPGTSTLAVCGDIEALPLMNASVDLVWSSLAIQWCDTGRVALEFQRILRPGGHLAATTLGPDTFAELRRAFVGVDEFRHTNDFIDETRLRTALGSAGFDLLTLRRVGMQRHYPDLRSLLASVRELGASHVAARNRRPGLMGKTAWRRFSDNFERMRTSCGLPLTYDTYFILAQK